MDERNIKEEVRTYMVKYHPIMKRLGEVFREEIGEEDIAVALALAEYQRYEEPRVSTWKMHARLENVK